jgi:transcriptional regulator with XRE-family HTH domain
MNAPNTIRHHRLARDLTLEELAERAGLSVSQVSRIERGKRQPTLRDLHSFARALRIPVAALVEQSPVNIVGYVGAGGEAVFYDHGQGPFEEVQRPPEASDRTVAVLVRGDSMSGTADDGWILYFDDVREPPADDLLGSLCVVGLSDGRILCKRLHRGRIIGKFDLFSTNASPMLDQDVAWAAKVTWIKPR